MDATNNSARGLQQKRPRPAPRMVVPAIPLPYVQKRQKQQEAAALAKARVEAMQTLVPAPVTETSSPTPPATEHTPTVVNGFSDHASEKAEEVDEPISPETPAEPAAVEEVRIAVEEEQVPVPEMEIMGLQDTPQSAPSEGPSSSSRSTYHMPPPFVPANAQESNTTNSDSAKFPPQHLAFNGHHPMHHAHPSNGSVMFGGYPESNNSSPAPPQSAGNAPPWQPFQVPYAQHGIGRHGPHQSNGGHPQPTPNGYSPMGPPPGYYQRHDGFMNHEVSGPEFARRHMMPTGHLSFCLPEGYSPSTTPLGVNTLANNYDPSTPHSFHGSQSSAPAEQESGPAFYSQYPTAVISNGSNGHVDEVRLYQQPRPKPRTGSQQLAQTPSFPNHSTGQPPLPMDHLDGLVNYLQSQFADSSLADFTLELRYSDDRAPPVRIPGHNLMFARSPTLKNLMSHQAQSDGLTVRTLLIESDDRFLRSDGFWMAVQRLYGGPLLDLGVLAAMNSSPTTQSSTSMPGPSDRFYLALGYAAAGQILQIPPVISRGVEIASHFINWNTVEKALDFSLDGGLDSQWTSQNGQVQGRIPSTYGPAVNVLIHSAMSFVITSFPAGFKLDTSVGENTHNPRLPAAHEDRPAGPNPRLSFIKFGDHPSEEVRSSSSKSITAILSKILVNLPFHLLKYVLESSRLGNVQGWATTVLRQEVMHAVIEEREKRRNKIHSSSILNNDRKMHSVEWDAVGWQESVQPLAGNEATPTLGRTWVDFTAAQD